jgi:DUF1009 family protein
MLGLIAGQGQLPVLLVEALQAAGRDLRVATLEGVETDLPDGAIWHRFRIEHLGSFLMQLQSEGVTEVCFAGAITRPLLDATQLDSATKPLVDRLVRALFAGDDSALREVVAIFEDTGLAVRSAAEVRPDLLALTGFHIGAEPTQAALGSLPRAIGILQALSAQDVGQSVVVAQGQCLGIETIQGTDALLAFVENSDAVHKGGQSGILVKGPKREQDLRVDMPTIGPATVRHVANAGLAGIVVQANKTLILERDKLAAEAMAAGVFVVARDLGL